MHLVTVLSSPSIGGREKIVLNILSHPSLSHIKHTVVFTKTLDGERRADFEKIADTLLVPLHPGFMFSMKSGRLRDRLESGFRLLFRRRLAHVLDRIETTRSPNYFCRIKQSVAFFHTRYDEE